MEWIFVRRIREVIKNKKEIERQLNSKLKISKNNVFIDGNALDEYSTLQVLEAINFGYSAAKALMLKHEDFVFKKIHIRDHTKRNLRDIKARLIGTHGKTRKTISGISECEVLIRESDVGIIGNVEDAGNVETAIINLIKGSKQGNMYLYLEKMNRLKKEENFKVYRKQDRKQKF